MNASERTREAPRRSRSTIVAALVVVSAALVSYQSLAAPSSSATSPRAAERLSRVPHDGLHGRHRGPLDETDGVVPDGATVFDNGYPGVANLDPALLGALREAATDAV